MRWNVAPFAVIIVALAGCAPKEAATTNTKPEPPRIKELIKDDVKVGTGPVAATGDTVWMKYRGTFAKDGRQFDSNMDGSKPFLQVILGAGTVIKGWEQGIPGMKEGGKRNLSVPASLAYGDEARDPIPKDADLKFEMELMKVLKPADAETIVIKTLKPGTGRACVKGDTITIEFEGKTLEGTVFDSSAKKGPATFKVGNDELLAKGLDDGILGMKLGEERRVELPFPMGIPVGMGTVQKPTVQSFTVKLVKIK